METLTKIQNSKIIKLFLLALAGSILITISAKIKNPFYPVPMTMQTFMVLLIGWISQFFNLIFNLSYWLKYLNLFY